jgi:hypothetical protein
MRGRYDSTSIITIYRYVNNWRSLQLAVNSISFNRNRTCFWLQYSVAGYVDAYDSTHLSVSYGTSQTSFYGLLNCEGIVDHDVVPSFGFYYGAPLYSIGRSYYFQNADGNFGRMDSCRSIFSPDSAYYAIPPGRDSIVIKARTTFDWLIQLNGSRVLK